VATIIESLYLPDLLDGLTLAATARGLSRVHFGESVDVGAQGPLVRKAERQLREFFAGERFVFDVALDLEGTAFQLEVWRALTKIPYAETCSYRDIAITVDRPKGYQAIGQANTRNPIPVIVPCHRVINADDSWAATAAVPIRKHKLLELERLHAHRFRETAA